MIDDSIDPSLSLARHLPRIALDWMLDMPEQRWRRVDGAMVFADISGFTALSARLATRGRIGAEELVDTLNRVFGGMIDIAARRGGQLLKFGGDALLFLFDHPDAAAQAASAAVDMRSELRRESETVTEVGRLSLSVSIGVHVGSFDCFLVGEPHRELVVLGRGVSEVVRAEGAAAAGQIVLSPAASASLHGRASRPRGDGELLLRWRKSPVLPIGLPSMRSEHDEVARLLLPGILLHSLDGVRPDPGHRIGTVAFLRFSGTDQLLAEQGPDELAERLHRTLQIAQTAFEAEDVALLCVDCDRDGGKLLASSGVPLTSEDDEGRMLRALQAINAAGPPLPLQIGVNRGHVFVAEIGAPERAAYSAMGDTTNTAARICGKAAAGEILAHPDVLAHARTRYEAEPRGPFTLKGKPQPQLTYRVGAELGRRDTTDPRLLPMLGRESEHARVARVVERAAAGRGGAVTVVGAIGVGKSRLVREALARVDTPRVLWLHAEPYGAANAFRVFRDPLRALLGIERGRPEKMADALRAAVASRVPQHVAMLALVGDVVQVGVPPSAAVAALLPQHRLDRTADMIVDLLAACFPAGLVLVVEDAHWADPASAHLIARIAREAEPRSWAVVCARRATDAGVRLDGGTEEIELGLLTAAKIRAITVTLTEAAPLRQHELDRIVERAAGNPLFATELVSATREFGSVDAVPASLQGTIAAQVDVLDPPARRTLSYASVLGRSFRRAVLLEVMSAEGFSLDEATYVELEQFFEAVGEERVWFRNGLLRDVVYDGLGYHLRARLHGEAGAAMERLAEDPAADADMLALHFARAGRHEKAYRYAQMAAERSERAFAFAEASFQLQQAIESGQRIETAAPVELRQLWIRLGDARDHAGLLPEAVDAFRHAGRQPGGQLDAAELILRRAQVRERMGAFPSALRECALARKAVAEMEDRAAESLVARSLSLAATVRLRQERAAQARDLAHEAIAIGDVCDDRTAVARAYSVLSWAEVVLGRPGVAIESGQRALELFDEVGDLFGHAQMANNLGSVMYFDGDWKQTVRLYEEAIEGYQRIGDVTNAQLSAANLAEVLVNQRRLDEAEPLLEEAARTLRASRHLWGAAFAEMQLGRLLVERGELERAEQLLATCVDEDRRMGSGEWAFEAAIHLAACHVAQGRPSQAFDVLDDVEHDGPSLYDAAANHVRGRALIALGRRADAVAAVRDGIRAARDRRLEYDLARLLVLADDLGLADVSEADAPVGEAGELFARLGVTGVA